MADLYRDPVPYGIDDVTVTGEDGTFKMRIYYPSDEGSVFGVPMRPGAAPRSLEDLAGADLADGWIAGLKPHSLNGGGGKLYSTQIQQRYGLRAAALDRRRSPTCSSDRHRPAWH